MWLLFIKKCTWSPDGTSIFCSLQSALSEKNSYILSATRKCQGNSELWTHYLTVNQNTLHYTQNRSQVAAVIYNCLVQHHVPCGVCEGYLGHSERDPISPAGWIMEMPPNHCNVVAVRLLGIYWSSCFFAVHLPNPSPHQNKNIYYVSSQVQYGNSEIYRLGSKILQKSYVDFIHQLTRTREFELCLHTNFVTTNIHSMVVTNIQTQMFCGILRKCYI